MTRTRVDTVRGVIPCIQGAFQVDAGILDSKGRQHMSV